MTIEQIKNSMLDIIEELEKKQYNGTTPIQSMAIGKARILVVDAALILESLYPLVKNEE